MFIKGKGLSFLILLFFVGNLFAQKFLKNSITTNSSEIVIELNIIDQIEIFVTDNIDKVTVITKSEDNKSTNFTLEDENGKVFIKSVENPLYVINNDEVEKLCSVQPIYTSYQVKIPKGKNVYVSFSQGNFYSNFFQGKLNLKLGDGIVKLNDFKGKIDVQINGGNVFCNQIENANIDINSNLGKVSSNLIAENSFQNMNQWKGLYGKRINELSIHAISANIHLKAK